MHFHGMKQCGSSRLYIWSSRVCHAD